MSLLLRSAAFLLVFLPFSAHSGMTSTTPSSTGSYTLSWTINFAYGHVELKEKVNSGSFQTVFTTGVNVKSKSFSGKAPGIYEYHLYKNSCYGMSCSPNGIDYEKVIVPPRVPGGLSAPSSNGTGAYSVSWSSALGASTYTLQESRNGGGWSTVYDGSGRGKSFTGKTSASYRYRVRACHPSTGCSGYSAADSTSVSIPYPAGLSSPSSSSTGSYTVSWSGLSGASSYTLQESRNGGSWASVYTGSGTSKALSGRGDGSTYRYRVRACFSACSGYSGTVSTSVAIPPSTPAGLNAPSGSTTGSYTVSWNSVSGTTYTLLESKNNGAWNSVYSGTASSVGLSGRGSGIYRYQVRACDNACSGYSSAVTARVAMPPSTPTINAPSVNGTGQYSISWSTVSGATGYLVQESRDNTTWSGIYDSSGSSTSVSGRSAGIHYYRVKACNVVSGFAGCSGWRASGGTHVKAPDNAPTLSVPATSDSGNYAVSWSAVTNSSRYTLQQQVGSGSWITVQDGATLSTSYTGNDNNRYRYQVRACNAIGCSGFSAIKTVDVAIPPGVPASISVPGEATNGAFGVSWGAASGSVSKYQLQQSKDGGTWSTAYDGTGRSKAISMTSAGSYAYRARACRITGGNTSCSGWRTSPAVSVTSPATAPAISLPANSSSGSFTVSWGAVANSSRYLLEEQVGADSWALVVDGAVLSKPYSGKGNNRYGYRVRACNAIGCSGYSTVKAIDVALTPSAPASISVPGGATDGTFSVSWGLASGSVSQYQLQQSKDGGAWITAYDGSGRSTTISVTSAGNYTYRARACRTSGSYTSCSSWRTSLATTVASPATAPALSAPASSDAGSFTVSWGAVDNSARYVLEEQVGSGGWAVVLNGTALSQPYTGKGNNSYSYRARACNAIGCSGYSAVKTVDVALTPGVPASILVPGGATDGTFSVSWGLASGAVSRYQLQQSKDGGTWSTEYDGSGRGIPISVTSAGSYTYRARACRITGSHTSCSDWRTSPGVTVAPPAAAPVLTVPARSEPGTFAVSWTPVPNTTRYTFQVLTGTDWVTLQDDQTLSKGVNVTSDGTYHYRVRACNTIGCSSFAAKSVDVASKPGDPSLPRISSDNTGGVDLNWDAPSPLGRVTAYELDFQINGGLWKAHYQGLLTSAGLNPLGPGEYTFRLRACNTVGSFTNCSNWRIVPEPIAKPSGVIDITLPPTDDDGSYSVSWNDLNDSFEYVLEEAGGPQDRSVELSSTVLPVTVESSGTYSYRVKACNNFGCSETSAVKSILVAIAPGTPLTLNVPERSDGDHNLDWEPSLGEVSYYQLQERLGSGSWKTVHNGEARAASRSGLTSGSYSYRVRACKSTDSHTSCSGWRTSVAVTVAAPEASPSNFTAPAVDSDGSYTLTWASVENSTSYQVQEQAGTAAASILPAVSGTQQSFNGKPENQYAYSVRACNALGCSAFTPAQTVTVIQVPGVPGAFSTPILSDGNHSLTWQSAIGEVHNYVLQERVNGGSWSTVYEGAGATHARSSLAAGNYEYQVKACNTVGSYTGCSNWRASDTVEVAVPSAVPANLNVPDVDEDGVFPVSWGTVANTTRYVLEQQVGSAGFVEVLSTDKTQYTLPAKAENQYTYRVKACNAIGCSGYTSSETTTVIQVPSVPGVFDMPSETDGNHIVAWGASVGDVHEYVLQEQVDSGEWRDVYTGTTPSHQRENLGAGTYTYRVKACKQVGDYTGCSSWRTSATVSSAIPIAPLSPVIVDQTENNFTVSWNEVDNSNGYEVQEQIGSGGWTTLPTVTNTRLEFVDRAQNQYSYRVKACNALGCSDLSTVAVVNIVIAPGAPTAFTASANAASGKTSFSWSENGSEVGFYQVQEYKSLAWSDSEVFNGTTGVWPHAAHVAGEYGYRIRACGTMGSHTECSAWLTSNSVTYTVPGGTALTAPGMSANGEYSVSWAASDHATYYALEENGVAADVTGTAKAFTGTDAKMKGSYSYRVKACNGVGCSDFSSRVTTIVTATEEEGDGSGSGGTDSFSGDLSPAPAAPQSGNPVGSIAGQFRVDESGAATYQVPFTLPQGTAGVAPQLSFNYSSKGGNSLMGQGWSLGGISAITRCRKTLMQDGQARPITWTQEDRFCLDGKRLVLHSNHEYGAVGASYKTEIDSFVTVTAQGGSAGNPASFKVTAKDGSTSFYGHLADAKLDLGNATFTWALSRFEDSVGNGIDFHYVGDASTGHRIGEIAYAYPSTGSGGTPGARVVFDYGDSERPDVSTSYVAGHGIKQTRRLAKVDVYNGSSIVRTYKLDYGNGRRLEKLEECVSSKCLPATSFEWTQNAQAAVAPGGLPFNVENLIAHKLVDMNGDQVQDLVWLRVGPENWGGTHLQVILGYAPGEPGGGFNLDGYSDKVYDWAVLPDDLNTVSLDVLDYNADGRHDVIVWASTAIDVFLSYPQEDGSWRYKHHEYPGLDRVVSDTYFADFTSNGLNDAYWLEGGQLKVQKLVADPESVNGNRPYTFASAVSYPITSEDTPQCSSTGYETRGSWNIKEIAAGGQTADFNGDGRADVVLAANHTLITYNAATAVLKSCIAYFAYVAVDDGFEYYDTVTPNDFSVLDGDNATVDQWNNPINLVDFNGDGLTDALVGTSVMLNQGTGFTKRPSLNLSYTPERSFADINDDGSPDLLWHDAHNDRIATMRWSGATENLVAGSNFTSDNVEDGSSYMAMDLTGNGQLDLLEIAPLGNRASFSVREAIAEEPRKPTAVSVIDNGLGRITEVAYGIIRHGSPHYSSTWGVNTNTQQTENCYNPSDYGAPYSLEVCQTVTTHSTDVASFYAARANPFSYLSSEEVGLVVDPDKPVLEILAPIHVVTSVQSRAPAAGELPGAVDTDNKNRIAYHYHHLRLQAGGRGLLGFEKLTAMDLQSGVSTETTYRQDWPFIGSPLETITRSAEGHKLNYARNTWDYKVFSKPGSAKRYQPYLRESHEERYELAGNGSVQGALLETTVTETTPDDYGNVVNLRTETEGGNERLIKTVTNDYGSGWTQELGRVLSTDVEVSTGVSTASGETPHKRRSTFTYYESGAKRGLLLTETVAAGTDAALTTEHFYDDFGNKTHSVQTDVAGGTRTSATTAYEDGRYVETVTNALGQVTQQVLARNTLGLPTEVSNINDVVTQIAYDDFGREYRRQDETGAWTWVGRLLCSEVTCPAGAEYRREERVSGGGQAFTYIDALGRTLRESHIGFDGTLVHVDTEYDRFGRARRVSTPYFAGQSPSGWTESDYDLLGRVTHIYEPNGTLGSNITYAGFVTTTTNALQQTKQETRNLQGELVRVQDNLGGTVSYTYDPDGNLLTATTDAPEADPVTVTMCYDTLGRKLAMHDPDKGGFLGDGSLDCSAVVSADDPPAGWWRYQYNGFGELETQIDAKRQTRDMTYDALGRMLTRTDYTASGAVETHTRWYYDAGVNGASLPGDLGNVTQVVQNHGHASETCDSDSYCELFIYDAHGRETDTIVFHPGATIGYMSGVAYDSIGRPYRHYDALDGLVMPASGSVRHFNLYGYESHVSDLASGDILRRTLAHNARGQVTQGERANGLTTTYHYDPYFGRLEEQDTSIGSLLPIQDLRYGWDAVGNLKSRENYSARQDNAGQNALVESFCYDGLNRLIKTHAGTLNGSCALSTQDQDVTYDGLGNIRYKSGVGHYAYGTNAGPHAVTGISDSANSGTYHTVYTYDGNGNMLSGDGRTLAYSTFDKPVEIGKNGHKTEFRYGPSRGRYQRVDTASNGLVTTTRYLGNVERIHEQGSGVITWRRTVAGAVYKVTTDLEHNVQRTEKYFIHEDHLGSTDVITDSVGTIVQAQSFDAWGQRRQGDTWDLLDTLELLGFNSAITHKGYTGHEQLDEVGLIHMNGRVYDPKLARFLQADPFIQAASNTQSYNRYSYLMNNPLNATDPSGFFLKKLWDEIRPFVGAIVAIALCAAASCVGSAEAMMWIGGISGAIGAAANGADFGGIVLGAVTGIAGGSNNLFAGAFFAGAAAYMSGGSLGRGFVAAGIGGGVGLLGLEGMDAIVVSIFAAGAASEITGGKFQNGAATAAFMWALQAGMSRPASSTPPDYDVDTGLNPGVKLDDDVGAVGDPEFSYSTSHSGPAYHEEVLVVGQAPGYAPVSFNLHMTGRYLYAQAQRNAHNAAMQAYALRVAEARSWDSVKTAANMVAAGSAAALCGGAMTACFNMASGAAGSALIDLSTGSASTPGALLEGALIGGITGPITSRVITLSGGHRVARASWRVNEFSFAAGAGWAMPNP